MARQELSKKEIENLLLRVLSHFGEYGNGRRDSAALSIGVSRRTLDAWCSQADPRTVPAKQLWELEIEGAFRDLPVKFGEDILDAYDENDEHITSTTDKYRAVFLSDVHCGSVQTRNGKRLELSEQLQQRSRLRRMIASGKVSWSQACDALGCDAYVLICYISEDRHRRTPPEFQVRLLEAYVREQMEEYA